MRRTIVNFDQDELGDWRALLDCGHRQHVRHQPPLISRPWVLTPNGRASMIGQSLNCVKCDDELKAAAGPAQSETSPPASGSSA